MSLIVIAIILAFALFWFYHPLRSMLVMSLYSDVHEKNSIMASEGFDLDIPGGIATPKRDWYPFAMTFNAVGFSGRAGTETDMSIIYNFPAFNPLSRTNTFYESDSPYSSAFYGAYVIRTNDDYPYGYFESGELNSDEVIHAFRYDYVNLVLESLGSYDFKFKPSSIKIEKTDYLGYADWDLINAEILTNSVAHEYKGFQRSYLQYGRPFGKSTTDFGEINITGRLYIRYFEEYNSTIALYIMAPDINVINNCDRNILSKSKISAR